MPFDEVSGIEVPNYPRLEVGEYVVLDTMDGEFVGWVEEVSYGKDGVLIRVRNQSMIVSADIEQLKAVLIRKDYDHSKDIASLANFRNLRCSSKCSP